jgi:hypothetical protein
MGTAYTLSQVRGLPPHTGCARRPPARRRCSLGGVTLVGRTIAGITTAEDIASVAGQLAELTHTVEEMAAQLRALQESSDSQQKLANAQQERAEIQQERIDLAARELAEVSARLQAAANALRESV